MRLKFLIISPVLMFQAGLAQNGPSSLTAGQGTSSTTASNNVVVTEQPPVVSSSYSTQTAIIDYQSVYEAPTLEEEVKMATQRFNLTPSQQDVWLSAATDRRQAEKIAREQLDSKSAEKGPAYKGLRMSQNTFYEIIIGYLSPAQKQALETDRVILEEKRKKIAKLAPPPAPTVTVAPIDSSAIKAAEKPKETGKKPKKKKKAVGA
jgi:hypothetical protein